jgi:hypothetical protein
MPSLAQVEMKHPSIGETRVRLAIQRAAITAVLFDPDAAEALLRLSDAEIGRLFKLQLCEVMGRAKRHNIDLPALRMEEENLPKVDERSRDPRDPEWQREPSAPPYRPFFDRDICMLLSRGKVLRAADFCRAANITEKTLTRYVASGRIFSIDVHQESYYPEFFLATSINPDRMAEVVRRLDDLHGWQKYYFLTTDMETHGGSTPLEMISIGLVRPVFKAAAEFVERIVR